MRLEQLRCVAEIVRQDYSVSRAADALDLPQPAVSRQLRALERELGVDIFVRRQKRLRGLTRPGIAIVEVAQRMLRDAENLAKIASDFSEQDSGRLVVATTHTQARYALPAIVKRFSQRYPSVRLTIRQGNPAEVLELVRTGEADICIGSESPDAGVGLALFPCYPMERVVLTPRSHPLTRVRKLTLEALVAHPIITYDAPFIGRSKLVRAFAARGLAPKIALSAADTDVIKAYVEQGLGIAIVAKLAYDPARDRGLRALDASHLFEANTIYLGVRRGDYLRTYMLDFIAMFAPRLDIESVAAALRRPEDASVRAG